MKLTVRIRKAMDGRLELQVMELPDLQVNVRRVADIKEAVRAAAAAFSGRPESDFHVEIGY